MSDVARYQLIRGRERRPGIQAFAFSTVNNGFADLPVINPELAFNPNLTARNIVRSSKTQSNDVTGLQEATLTFQAELAGSTNATATTIPPFSDYLEACGFERRLTFCSTIVSAVAGGTIPFGVHGEVLNDGTSDVGILLHDTQDDATVLRYQPYQSNLVVPIAVPTVPATGAVLTGVTSGTAFTTGALAGSFEGYTWHPTSDVVFKMTAGALSAAEAGDIPIGTTVFDGTTNATGVIVASPLNNAAPATADTVFFIRPGVTGDWGATGTCSIQRGGGATNDITFTGVDTHSVPAMTIYLGEDGPMKKAIGMRGTVAFAIETGGQGLMTFNFRGRASGEADNIGITSPTVEVHIPPVFLGASLGVGDTDDTDFDRIADHAVPCINSIGWDINNTQALFTCANSASGIKFASLPARDPSGSIDPLVDLEASFPFLGKLRAGTSFNLRAGWGTVFKNAFKFSIPAAQIESEGKADSDGLAQRDMSLKLKGGSANGIDQTENEIVLTYIAATGGLVGPPTEPVFV